MQLDEFPQTNTCMRPGPVEGRDCVQVSGFPLLLPFLLRPYPCLPQMLCRYVLPGDHVCVGSQAWLAYPAFPRGQRMAVCPKSSCSPPRHRLELIFAAIRTLSLLHASLLICVTSPWFHSNLKSWPPLCLWSCSNEISSWWKEVVRLKDLATSRQPRLPWGVNNPGGARQAKTSWYLVQQDFVSHSWEDAHVPQTFLPFWDVSKFRKSLSNRRPGVISQAQTRSIWRMGTHPDDWDCTEKRGLEKLSKCAQKWHSWAQRTPESSYFTSFNTQGSDQWKKKPKKGLATLPSPARESHMSSAEYVSGSAWPEAGLATKEFSLWPSLHDLGISLLLIENQHNIGTGSKALRHFTVIQGF